MYIFVLPAYNEEAALGVLLDRIRFVMAARRDEYRVLVVDDGSSDKTSEVAQGRSAKMPIEILPHRINQGLGAALRTGLKAACGLASQDAAVITMDADDTHDPAAAIPMRKLLRQGCDVVIASRYGPGAGEIGVSRLRRLFSKVVCTLLRILFPVPGVSDYSSGFRMYRAEIIERGFAVWGDRFIQETSFTCMAEVLLKLRRIGARFKEHSAPLHYDRKKGPSKLRRAYTILCYLRLIGRELKVSGGIGENELEARDGFGRYRRADGG